MSASNVIWTAKEAASATSGRAPADWKAFGVSIDSRTVCEGDLFVALAGDHGDGHAYVAAALEKGAVAAVVSRIPEGVDEGRLLVVEDTFKALQDLGGAARARSGAKIIGVTGSVGKTGTKEMLAAAFGACGQVHASGKSYNNHWGVPLSLAQMHAGCDFGVFEMGMNHSGEIVPLTRQVRPDIAIITTIQPVHIESFEKGEEGIAEAKAEIFEGMKEGAAAVLPRDCKWFGFLEEKAKARGLRVCSFGEDERADVCMLECLIAANGSRVKARVLGEEIVLTLQAPGRHIASNALSVLAAVKLSGCDLKKAAKALAGVVPPPGRGRREYLDIGDPDNPVTLIDESYNASPVAMRAAFKVLALIDPGRGGRRIAVLGDMYELGKDAPRLHADMAVPLQNADVQFVYTSGPLMKNLYNALPEEKRGAHRDDSAELAQIVPEVLVPGDVVMVKGSRGGGEKPRMQLVVEALRALPEKLRKKD
ncbi:MAG: UDP-N-acetylmuramoyl-tripeptide--D-alanyl-D-alanine ligase [Rhodospirillales bacterium]|nr:UDP-N-acetylmuramoyl-tripeptide--D-alanyl-D-alanine ligase [Alphaproteobacteria bacterium]USO04535.1 MAG: UDP-N-acetylmuramoyl-tripeptide--D-alanyl-D-alanine ligase [Rhodospirillales bacterium]